MIQAKKITPTLPTKLCVKKQEPNGRSIEGWFYHILLHIGGSRVKNQGENGTPTKSKYPAHYFKIV